VVIGWPKLRTFERHRGKKCIFPQGLSFSTILYTMLHRGQHQVNTLLQCSTRTPALLSPRKHLRAHCQRQRARCCARILAPRRTVAPTIDGTSRATSDQRQKRRGICRARRAPGNARVPAASARRTPECRRRSRGHSLFPGNAGGVSLRVHAGRRECEQAAGGPVELGFGGPKIILLRRRTSAFSTESSSWLPTCDSQRGCASQGGHRRVVASALDSERTEGAESGLGWSHKNS
jgi:hypothetical protein